MSKYTALLLERADVLTRGQLVHSDHLLTPGPAVPTKAQEGSLCSMGWSARATVPGATLHARPVLSGGFAQNEEANWRGEGSV